MFQGKENARVAVLIGTRPGIIKMAPLIKELEKRHADFFVIHTGQHYSIEMDKDIMNDVEIKDVRYHIKRPEDCTSHAQQTSYMLVNVERILMEERPDIILVCGDANTNFAGAFAARKLHIAVGHVESGLRSFDWRMPEEHNRIIIDHISEFLFAPTQKSKEHLIKDNVAGKIFVVGNTIVDAAIRYADSKRLDDVNLVERLPDRFALATLHREENVDDPAILKGIFTAFDKICREYNQAIVFPIHPRTRKMAIKFGYMESLKSIPNMVLIEPVPYRTFLALIESADLVMTDSGGLQEEACILKTPCLTLRISTERHETVSIGANIIGGTQVEDIIKAYKKNLEVFNCKHSWPNPFGDGKASKRIIDTCFYGKPEDEFDGIG